MSLILLLALSLDLLSFYEAWLLGGLVSKTFCELCSMSFFSAQVMAHKSSSFNLLVMLQKSREANFILL